jgi:pimeloyl-ACP methyl ester carboxylesterase
MPTSKAAGAGLYYEERGQGVPLVLLHGLGESIEFWEYQIPAFSKRYRLITIDLPGFGRSQRHAKSYSIANMAQAVWQLLETLGVDKFYLLGHSMGGAVAQQLTLEHKSAVSKLVLANTVPAFKPITPKQHFEVWYRKLVMRLLGPVRLARIGAQRMFPGEHQEMLRAKSEARGARNNGKNYLDALSALTRWSVLHRLHEYTMPVLVLAAEHDYFSRDDMVQFAHGLPKGRFYLFAGAHHAMAMEMPDEFNAVVLKFLDGK